MVIMSEKRTEISSAKHLPVGSIVELVYRYSGSVYTKAIVVALVEDKINANPAYQLINAHYGDTTFTYRVRLVNPSNDPVVQQAGISPQLLVAGIAMVAGGLVLWLSLDKIYQITETLTDSPAGKILVAGTGIALPIIALAVLAYFVIKGGWLKK